MSSRLDERIHTMMQQVVDESPLPPSPPEAPTVFVRRPIPNWAIAAVAAVAAILIIGTASVLFGGSDGSVQPLPPAQVTTTSEPIDEPVDEVTSETTPAVPLTADAWERVGEDAMADTLGLFDITTFGNGFAAVGWRAVEGPAVGAVFVSDDGTSWRQVASDDPVLTSSNTLLYTVTEGDGSLVTAGIGCESGADPCAMSGAPWTSRDGTEWTRVPHNAAVFGDLATQMTGIEDVIVASDGTLLAVGATDSWTYYEDSSLDTVETTPTVWRSVDGVVWEKVWEGEGFELTRFVWDGVHTSPMLAVAEDPEGGFTAVGKMLSPHGIPTAAAWTSADGLLWEPVTAFETTLGENTTMTDIAWGSEGFVIVGTEGGHTPAIWRSTGPSYWTRISMLLQPFKGIGSLGSVAPLEDGYVIAGPHPYLEEIAGAVTVWTSTDGERWDRVHQGGPGTVATVLADHQHTMLAGTATSGGEWHGSVWIGPSLDPTNPPPDPGVETIESPQDAANRMTEEVPTPDTADTADGSGHPTPELTPVQWMIDFDHEAPGIHLIFTVVNAQPVTAENVQEVSGTLVWDETEVQLCSIDIREGGDDWLHIGDIFGTTEGCGENPTAMQDAFDTYGLPDDACVAVTTTDNRTHEFCAPLKGTG